MDKREIEDLQTPAFIVDKNIVERNCRNMLQTARDSGISLRGQTKTHKTVEGGILQTGGTRRKIVTSTLVETEMYAENGFEDILYGFPLISHHIDRIYKLRERLDSFHVMVTNMEICKYLQETKAPDGKLWSIVLKIDCGNKRAGVWHEDETIFDIARYINSAANLHFQGIYAHCGNSYGAASPAQVGEVRDFTLRSVKRIAEQLESLGIHCEDVGIGSTPSCSHPTTEMSRLTEIHPGNYVFYDAQQMELGSCTEQDIACRVVSRVIGHYPDRGQMLIDCGFLGITKQGLGKQENERAIARVEKHDDIIVTGMTQEIGFVESADPSKQLDFSKFPIGSTLRLIPYHSCATAACYPVYHIHQDEILVDTWTPCRGW